MIPAGDWIKNAFGAQNPARIGSKTLFRSKTRREFDQKRFWSPKPAEDYAKNASEAQNPARIAQ